MRRAVLYPLGIAVLLVLAACSSGGDSSSTTTTTTTTTAASTDDLTLADLNMLHGLPLEGGCTPETDSCQAEARLRLLWDAIEHDAGCPDVITLQEVGPAQLALIPQHLAELCDGGYEVAGDPVGLPVEVMILSRLPVLDQAGKKLSGLNWALQWARLKSDLGPVEVATAHFASSSDPFACQGDYCADLCPPGGYPGDCHPLEVLDFFETHATAGDLQVFTGDLNRPVTDTRVRTLLDAGFVDSWTQGRNPECDPKTGAGCTCCVSGPNPYGGLDKPDSTFDERIDFVLVRAPSTCDVTFDGPDDPDGDGVSTGPFARQPASDPVKGVFWPSDHSGVQADVSCG